MRNIWAIGVEQVMNFGTKREHSSMSFVVFSELLGSPTTYWIFWIFYPTTYGIIGYFCLENQIPHNYRPHPDFYDFLSGLCKSNRAVQGGSMRSKRASIFFKILVSVL